MDGAFVAVLMGSDSDYPTMQAALEQLDEFGIVYEVKVSSAHRTPEATRAYVLDAERRGCAIFVAAAGMAAHLAGAIAATTTRPVVGVPMGGGALAGMDALLSTVQMPSGIPVATVAIGKAGARNAAYLCAQILALGDEALAVRVREERQAQTAAVIAKDEALPRPRSPT